MAQILGRIGLLAAGAGVTSAFFINLCNLIFQCGCVSWWAGAADHCNIQQAGLPDCPWCQQGGVSGGLAYGLILAAQAAAAFWPGAPRWGRRAASVLAAFPVVGGFAGLVTGLWFGYWSQ